MWHLFFFLFLHFQLILSSPFNKSSSPSPHKLCSPDQSLALLHFKNSISVDEICKKYSLDSYPKTNSWKENSDCFSWDGVTCDTFTGHVIGLDLSSSCVFGIIDDNSTLFLLHHLQQLNLAFDYFYPSNISSKFAQFKELTHLNLSSSHFDGLVPTELSHLSNLVSLDLSSLFLELEQDSFNKIVQNLTKLRYLHLDWVNMSSVSAASLVNLSSSSISLSLASTNLQGRLPTDIFHLPFLQRLSLSDNYLLTGNLPKSNWSGPLRFMNLSHTSSFSSELPDTMGNLKYLNVLDLAYSNFTGGIPPSISNVLEITSLSLSNNMFSGEIPFWLFTLPSLESLSLSNNKFIGPIPDIMFLNFNLTRLDLSSNNLSGILKSDMLANLKNLEIIDLSYNNLLSITPHSNINFSLPNLKRFRFSSCNLKEFPKFLRNAENLKVLDLSNNKISGQISLWEFGMWSDLVHLNLSQNFLTSFAQIPPGIQLQVLDLDSNLLQGRLLDLPTEIVFYSASNNKLTGGIPSSFCNLSSIEYLILSNNSFNGTIPHCLGNSIVFLDLRMNNFHGKIPQTLAVRSIRYLNLNGNRLVGELPPSLAICSELEVLDVGNNKINDTFPHWLASLPVLQVLILRANRFHGPICNPTTINLRANRFNGYPFAGLRILDLSHNQFDSLLPTRYFASFESMMYRPYDDGATYMEANSFPILGRGPAILQRLPSCNRAKPYRSCILRVNQYRGATYRGASPYYSMVITMKGFDIKMERILISFTAIDLSKNLFQGGIPRELGKLISLKVLNFSQNKLYGKIPSSLGNLTELESLDLSSNKLTGEIPIQLTSLTFLAVLNLSYNKLIGHIPQGNQFDTFQNNSFIGNLGLCGFQLSKECSNSKAQEPPGPTMFLEEDDSLGWFDWKVTTMGYACGLVIGFSMGYIVFVTRKPQWFVRMVERQLQTKVRRLSRRCRGRRHC